MSIRRLGEQQKTVHWCRRPGKAVLRCLIGETFSDKITQQFEDCWQLRLTPEMAIINHVAGGQVGIKEFLQDLELFANVLQSTVGY